MLSCEWDVRQQGFTLIEVMISIVVAMVVLAGLMLTFVNQSNKYQYENKRIDASQDLEFAIKFIARDLRSSLLVGGTSSVVINDAAVAPYATTDITFSAWDAATSTRVTRYYKYVASSKSLKYDKSIPPIGVKEILPNVTLFKVFEDGVTSRAGYADIPAAQPNAQVPDPTNPEVPLSAPGYTILIELEVPVGYKGGSKVDVRGVATATKRIWRYAQVHPMAAVQ